VEKLDLLQSTIADRYVIEREIGSGGMATVYLARDIRHDRPVALKVLKPELAAVLGVERFLSEIKVTANLQHPNLLPLFDSGEADGRLFYVMPYVAGESLRARLDRERQLPVAEAVRIASSVASALHYAHRNGVIHRDLKPENILMHEGQPLVADFGIALAVSKAGGTRITESGLSLGTPHYMSPEQATADHQIDGRTDIYSLGAVLYEMLTGEPPHTGKTAQAIVARVLTETPRSIRATRPAVPEELEAVISRALEKLPADRFGTAQEFSNALNEADVDETVIRTRARKSPADSPAPSTFLSARRKTAVPWIIAVIALAAAVLEGGWLVTHRAAPRRTVRFTLDIAPDESVLDPGGIVVAASPDGNHFAYLARKAGGLRKLFIRKLGDLSGKEVVGSDEAYGPFFSADGKWIGFRTGTELKKVPISGGTPVSLGETGDRFFGAASMPNGDIIMSADTSLLLIPSSGGVPRSVSKLDSSRDEVAQRWPLALSDGEHVLFGSYPVAGTVRARIGVVSIKTGKSRLLDIVGTCPVALIDGLLIYSSAAGALLAVPFDERTLRSSGSPVAVVDQVVVGPATGPAKAAASRSGSLIYLSGSSASTIVVADTQGTLRPLITNGSNFSYPRFSPDGKRIALSQVSSTGSSIWIYTIASGTLQRLTAEGTINDRPEWSPDGRSVVFRSNRSSRDNKASIWRQPADGSGAAELLFRVPGSAVNEAVISPDGRTLVARVTDPLSSNSFQARGLTGDTGTRVLSGFSGLGARISPDGDWLAYASRLSGLSQVYVTPLEGPPAQYQVSTYGGITPVWSPDGKSLLYGTTTRQIVAATLTFTPAFGITSRRTLFDGNFNFDDSHASFDISPDGRNFLIPRSNSADARLILVHDWREELSATVRAAQH
jgi:serine/threonine-protein kinase